VVAVESGDFVEFRKKVFNLYREGNYSKALEIAEEAHAKFIDRVSETSYWLACLNSVLHNGDKAIEILKSSLNAGIFWSPKGLEKEKDFESIRERKEFRELLEKFSQIYEEMQKSSKPEKLVFYPDNFDNKKKYSLFVALHEMGGNAEEFSTHWKHVLKRGYILLVPQSSQLFGTKRYCWDDWGKGKKEVLGHIMEIKEKHSLIEDDIIIAGASQGASFGFIDLVLGGTPLNFRKFILVIPPVDDLSFYVPLLESGARKGVKGYIIAGGKDIFIDSTKKLHSEMEKAGLQCKLTVIPGMGHEFPSSFDNYLDEALEYLKGP
jgi:predicted esterase